MNLGSDRELVDHKRLEEPVNNSAKHVGVVLGKVVRAALLLLLLDGGAVVICQVFA